MWRGEAIYFSISTRPSPNAASASRIALSRYAAHAPPAAAGDRLDQHRIADLIGLLAQELRVLVVAVIAGNDRHASPLHQGLGRAFETHRAHRRRRRANEYDAR